MSPERWRKIRELFEAALDRPVDQRAEFLKRACAGDQEVQQRVEAMLTADERENLPIDHPAYEAVPPLRLQSSVRKTCGVSPAK